jgi:hypothetical protein
MTRRKQAANDNKVMSGTFRRDRGEGRSGRAPDRFDYCLEAIGGCED